MTEANPTLQPEFLFSERAFAVAQKAGATALIYEQEELTELITFINDHSQRQPLPSPEETTFIAMHPSKNPLKSEKHYYQLSGLNLYPFISSDNLGGEARPQATTNKGDLDVSGRHIFEYRPWTAVGSMTRWIARRGFGPPPQEAKIIASADAWSNQLKGLKSAEAETLEDEAVKKFPGAVRITHRPIKRTLG